MHDDRTPLRELRMEILTACLVLLAITVGAFVFVQIVEAFH